MVCDRAWMLEFTKSAFMLGVLVGAGVVGLASDRFGRRRTFIGAALLQMLSFNILPFVADSFYAILFMNFFNGAVQHGTFLCAFVLSMEVIGGFAGSVCAIWTHGYFTVVRYSPPPPLSSPVPA